MQHRNLDLDNCIAGGGWCPRGSHLFRTLSQGFRQILQNLLGQTLHISLQDRW